jgi:hypothetical protein
MKLLCHLQKTCIWTNGLFGCNKDFGFCYVFIVKKEVKT